nr:accessory gene regulator B family protein [uncultured Blautia sp.]
MKITEKMWQLGMIEKEEQEFVYFGMIQMIHGILNWFLVILLGYVFQISIWQSIFFYFSYCILRIFAGGYHAPTRASCYICSVLMISVAFAVSQGNLPGVGICSMIYLLVFCIIWHYAPIDNPNKRLSMVEKIRFRKSTQFVLLLSALFFACAVLLCARRVYYTLLLAHICVCIMLGLGILQEIRR